MKKILITLVLFTSTTSYAQLENAIWCFRNSVKVDFNLNQIIPSTCSNGGNVAYSGSPASVSNANGGLLFYSSGNIIWDKDGNIMPLGSGLWGGSNTLSVPQTTLIVPKPNDNNIYYVFTVNYGNYPSTPPGIFYTVVDMSLPGNGTVANPKGDVVSNALKNVVLNSDTGSPFEGSNMYVSECRLSSTLNYDKTKIWVTFFTRFSYIDPGSGSTTFTDRIAYSYLITANGINNTTDGVSPNATKSTLLPSSYFPMPNANWYAWGCLKFSPDGQYVCDANTLSVTIYKFKNTGSVDDGTIDTSPTSQTPPNMIYVTSLNPLKNAGYGLEFSPNSNYIYFSSYENVLYQGNFSTRGSDNNRMVMRIRQARVDSNTSIIIGQYELPPPTTDFNQIITPLPSTGLHLGGLQLAINNRIYVCSYAQGYPPETVLGEIHDPNAQGSSCNFNEYAIQLYQGTRHEGIFPQWVHKVIVNAWPKVYDAGKGIYHLGKDNNGNLFATLGLVFDFSNNINHVGYTPPPPYFNGYTVQYNYFGLTSWSKTNEYRIITLNSGNIQMYDQNSTFLFYNGSTGNPASPPLLAVPGESIIAEPVNGSLISIDSHNNNPIFVHSTQGTTSINVASPRGFKFNRSTNKLFIEDNTFKVYSFSPTTNTLTLIASVLLPVDPISNKPIPIAQIDNQDRVFVVKDQMLQQFDYLANTFTPVTISGFNNTSVYVITSYNPYTEDRCLVSQGTENNLYAIDLNAMTERKIHHTKSDPYFSCYLFDGDDLFLGGAHTTMFTIGSQTIPVLNNPSNVTMLFLTKLNLQGDFNFQSQNSLLTTFKEKTIPFNIILLPNPVKNNLKIEIKEDDKQSTSLFTITIANQIGNITLKSEKYTSGKNLDISSIKTGMYYVEVLNSKGDKLSKSFFKL